MSKLIITLAIATVLFGWAGSAHARGQIIKPEPDEAFVQIFALTKEVNLGTTKFQGLHILDSAVTVRVKSNCLHGSIFASTTGLNRSPYGFIPPERISIKSPVTNGFVPMSNDVMISKPVFGDHDITLSFKVQTSIEDPEGIYTGTLILTLMPPS